jgi:hypothetical protein
LIFNTLENEELARPMQHQDALALTALERDCSIRFGWHVPVARQANIP